MYDMYSQSLYGLPFWALSLHEQRVYELAVEKKTLVFIYVL